MATSRLLRALREQHIDTPAFVYDENRLIADARLARDALPPEGTRLLFAMKSFAIDGGLRAIAPVVDGFHASSLFEARLARQILGNSGIVHLTTPGLRPDDASELFELCDHVSFNSIPQWDRHRKEAGRTTKCGLRVNPRLSNVADERYDPCGRHSKLGATVEDIRELYRVDARRFEGLSGLLFHTNCDAVDTSPILETVRCLAGSLAPLLERLEWIDLGGGYLFRDGDGEAGVETRLPWRMNSRRKAALEGLRAAIDLLRTGYGLEVLVEPGASISRRAGTFVTSVIDLFESSGRTVAILDTTVNHMPEVLEFQFAPDVLGDLEEGGHRYLLAGATCLAGDVFGEYAFREPLVVGSRLLILDMGAYSMVKAHMFNGVNLPAIHALGEDGSLSLQRRFMFDDFLARCAGVRHVYT